MAITLRNIKGTALTHVELDANFTTLQNADLDSAAVTAIITASADFKLYVSKVFNPPRSAKLDISETLF